MSRIAAVVLALPLLLAGCGGGDDATDASDTADTPEEQGVCALLTADEVREISGQELTETHEIEIADELPACVWGSLNEVGVQAARVDAGVWAESLPDVVAELRARGLDAENLQKLDNAAELIETGETIPAEDACGLFSELTELNGMPKGTDVIPTIYPSEDDPQAVTVQGCRDGTYVTVLLTDPIMADAEAAAARLQPIAERLFS